MSGSAPTSPSTQPKQKAVTGTFSTFDQDEQHRKLIREGEEARAALSSSLPLSLYVLHFGNKILQGSKQHRNPLADLALTRMTPRIVKQPWWKRLITTNRRPSGQVVKPVSELEAYLLAVPYAFPLYMSSQVMEEDIVQLSATDYSLRTAVENLDYQEMKLIHSIKNRLARTGRDCTIMALTSGRPSDLIPLGPSGSLNSPSTTLLFLLKHVSRPSPQMIAQQHSSQSQSMAVEDSLLSVSTTVPRGSRAASAFSLPATVLSSLAGTVSSKRAGVRSASSRGRRKHADGRPVDLQSSHHITSITEPVRMQYAPTIEATNAASSTNSNVYIDTVDDLLARWTTAFM